MDNQEKLAALGTQDKLNNNKNETKQKQTKNERKNTMCWIPLNANKHK